MKKSALITALAASMMLVSASAGNADASSFKLFGSKIELAYAAQPTLQDNRFEQFDEANEEEMHELNDAWLGMPVRSSDGKLAGYVEDAYLDANGDVNEILVGLSGRNYGVYVSAARAELTDTEVMVSLTNSAIANLKRDTDFEVSSR
jgi:hypothetical protein